jgi:hypothetical protein
MSTTEPLEADLLLPPHGASVGVNHRRIVELGKVPGAGPPTRPAYSAAFRGGSPALYSPASNSTGSKIILLGVLRRRVLARNGWGRGDHPDPPAKNRRRAG